MGSKLSVGLVCHDTKLHILEKCLSSLLRELSEAINENLVSEAEVYLLDNSQSAVYGGELHLLTEKLSLPQHIRVILLSSTNKGFGAGHNEVLGRSAADIHLIVNPDLEFLPYSIANAVKGIDFGITGIVVPKILNSEGFPLRLHLRRFRTGHIFLRSIAPGFIKKLFRKNLRAATYPNVRTYVPVESSSVFSGCCMLFDSAILKALGGFDERYFLYFEDYDLSLRALMKTSALIEPDFQVIHHGGNTSKKGRKHIFWFLASAIRFYWGRFKSAIRPGERVC
ncbi:glycosyltransferase [Microbulbifer guangxiensis]|uniref:glycosyltransferase n=1 Tax=Microbulbifer guangxiensis TaxID=2904249 RepID=UPI001F351460|nr:glycosyltransferase family 2 protein [Microbulbifer guangxiensis]